MNQFTAPIQTDVDHHRNRFEPSVRAALGILDRVEDGQDVSSADVMLALEVTGDAFAHSDERGHKREYARPRAFDSRPRAES